ncbi:MAG TPA: ABC transporter ATP-binding protein [Nocardioidaceae bacterium]
MNLSHSRQAGPPAVALDDVSRVFGAVRAVDGLSLTIQPGEIVALLGPNGAGKTTTIDMILGLSTPTRGDVSVYGLRPVDAMVRGLVSAVMQSGGLLKDYTVEETVQLTASLFPSSRPVSEVMQRAGLEHIAGRRVGACSGGEQQRLRFALALLPDPELLILDEPTTGMDVTTRREFWSAIRRDAHRGRTVIFATHYLEEADAYADRVVLVRSGRLVADGTASQIKGLASGRTVRATIPESGDHADAVLRSLPGVDLVERRGDTVFVHGSDSDAVARLLLTSTDARDLEITSRNLEDAFVALTSDDLEGVPS